MTNDIAFALHLGGGIYLHSNGDIQQCRPGYCPDSTGSMPPVEPPVPPVYEAPFELPADPKVIKEALKEIKTALKDANKNSEIVKKFESLGFSIEYVDLLAKVGVLAGQLAPIFVVVAAGVDVLKFLGILKDGPSAVEVLINKRFDQLEQKVDVIKQLIIKHNFQEKRAGIQSFGIEVKNIVDPGIAYPLTREQLETDRAKLQEVHTNHLRFFMETLDSSNYEVEFRPKEHNIWLLLQQHLFTIPGDLNSPVRALRPGDTRLRFDHRLMIPLACSAVESYLASIRAISPEYRTTGEFRASLREFAIRIDNLAHKMREFGLARTIYQPVDFMFPDLEPTEVNLFTNTISKKCGRWPVGALDLCVHDDAFFGAWNIDDEHWNSGFLGQLMYNDLHDRPNETTTRGLMNFRWIPPAVLEPTGFGTFRIMNPEECAIAANEQAERAYAELLAVSGYSELLQLATLLRNEATDPVESQTVKQKSISILTSPLEPVAITVMSNPVDFTGEVITSPAKREPRESLVRVTIATQPIKRARPVVYKIKLRTLNSLPSRDSWHEPDYGEYQVVNHTIDDLNFLKTEFSENKQVLLDEYTLIGNWTSSPSNESETKRMNGSVQMKAHTFDWWIPVDQPFTIAEPFENTVFDLRALNWKSPIDQDVALNEDGFQYLEDVQARTLPRWTRQYFQETLDFKWRPGEANWEGQHREVREESVTFEYELYWVGDRLTVEIKGNPVHRNYVVFLVVEELLGSQQILHTAFRLPVNGQLTFVPRKFFDDEFAAHAKTAGIIADLIARYIPRVQDIEPSDPIAWVRPSDLVSVENLKRVTRLVRDQYPDLLNEVMIERGSGEKRLK